MLCLSAVKIVLKGDRNTGKTCLFNRMGGKPFQEAYIPTMEIQVGPVLQLSTILVCLVWQPVRYIYLIAQALIVLISMYVRPTGHQHPMEL